jgi:hypothetical protein
MERKTLDEDDLTEERQITPGEREDVAESESLDPSDDGVDRPEEPVKPAKP